MKKLLLFAISFFMLGSFSANAQLVKGDNQSDVKPQQQVEKPKVRTQTGQDAKVTAMPQAQTEQVQRTTSTTSTTLPVATKPTTTTTSTTLPVATKPTTGATLGTATTTNWDKVLDEYEQTIAKLASIAEANKGKKVMPAEYKTILRKANELKMRLQKNQKDLNDKQIARRDDLNKKLENATGVQQTRTAR